MDDVFHAASAVLLARGLGEKRRPVLALAAIVGCAPDLAWYVLEVVAAGKVDAYAVSHCLKFSLTLGAIAVVFSWRIAFGGLLHLAIDQLTHASSGVNELVPFLGLDWWRGRGLILWAALWLGLIAAALVFFLGSRRKARWRPRRPKSPRGVATARLSD